MARKSKHHSTHRHGVLQALCRLPRPSARARCSGAASASPAAAAACLGRHHLDAPGVLLVHWRLSFGGGGRRCSCLLCRSGLHAALGCSCLTKANAAQLTQCPNALAPPAACAGHDNLAILQACCHKPPTWQASTPGERARSCGAPPAMRQPRRPRPGAARRARLRSPGWAGSPWSGRSPSARSTPGTA